MAFRFVHTADVHLDSPLRSLALKDPELADVVANATRSAFVATVDLCLEENVDALLIAGDLYDGKLRSMKTAAFFAGEMRRLTSAAIQVFIVKGNHDAESLITRHLVLPDGVHVFSSRGESVVVEEAGVVLHGVSFAKPEAPDSLLPKYKPAVDGMLNIGLLHTSLAGSTQHDTYSPCSIQELTDQGYDYWALGHIHQREVHSMAVKGSGATVVMPGIPQGRHINEAGPKSVTLVEIDDDRTISVEERFTSSVQFERVAIDVSGFADWQELPAAFESALGEAAAAASAEYLISRVTLEGTSVLASRLLRDRDLLLTEIAEAGRRIGQVLIESVLVEVSPESPDAELVALAADPVAELRRIVAESAGEDSPVLAETLELVLRLQQALPPEIRDALGTSDAELRAGLASAAKQGAAEVLARLEAVGTGG